ncbi:hypothetical protein BDQ12DRAFT_441208 [Crucibulum laeve]|uniref:Uncharacterized protein n=1 Tax=Crucibulum laeve TaxID=68775 RepID=A0A5C3LKM9_9AGAR|nr:hypothetical protein BDQ12DRAFT_441208 [Crucibulum laeve]
MFPPRRMTNSPARSTRYCMTLRKGFELRSSCSLAETSAMVHYGMIRKQNKLTHLINNQHLNQECPTQLLRAVSTNPAPLSPLVASQLYTPSKASETEQPAGCVRHKGSASGCDKVKRRCSGGCLREGFSRVLSRYRERGVGRRGRRILMEDMAVNAHQDRRWRIAQYEFQNTVSFGEECRVQR